MKDFKEKLADLLADGFQIEDLESAARIAAAEALRHLPGATISEQIDWARDAIIGAVEAVDHLVPVFGQWMDLDAVNAVQRWGVTEVCNRWIRPLLSWAREDVMLNA